jgi:hypothetical protein
MLIRGCGVFACETADCEFFLHIKMIRPYNRLVRGVRQQFLNNQWIIWHSAPRSTAHNQGGRPEHELGTTTRERNYSKGIRRQSLF